jgi:hypothetical protein
MIRLDLIPSLNSVSYGGKEMYQAPNGPYSVFAGRDASRALAKMSFDPADLNSSNISDLTEDEIKVCVCLFTFLRMVICRYFLS